jgi:hypothetical protein
VSNKTWTKTYTKSNVAKYNSEDLNILKAIPTVLGQRCLLEFKSSGLMSNYWLLLNYLGIIIFIIAQDA